ncbi:hypothetical protein DFP74_0540 [Nocardiopsis sp. Huas11]|uniref:hypothetical protein n=1 Tax=Nocardiopsis sp. Huas11 TaxID=2183912 RepID=UPI000F225295|nr:hypothetical protein [Nocardiopsis sp. Huas11]RKS04960.1 hypothetical protein DFP74_0540 [Nocardiopsis sp. Huas11]
MTHAHHVTTSTDRGRPPLAVWPCAPHAGQDTGPGQVPHRLARRLVDEYTRPGQVVADLTGSEGRVAAAAQASGCSSEVLTRTLPGRAEGCATTSGVAWADLAVTTISATCLADRQARERKVRGRMLFAATITRPGGIVAVITPVAHTPTLEVVDPAPGVVRAASCAGLVYLQHVIALTAPVCEAGLGATIRVHGDFDPVQEEVENALPASVADAAATITSPAHLNVSVFRLPRRGRPSAAGTTGEVGA